MSRTYKDRPFRIRFPKVEEYEYFEYISSGINYRGVAYDNVVRKYSTKRAGVLVKKPRRRDTEWHWQSTPSWWTNMFMIRPERTRANRETSKIKCIPLDKLDLVDIVNFKKKPHVYCW